MSNRLFLTPDPGHQKKIGPKVVIEAMLDLALIAGFLATVGLLTKMTIRLIFLP
jgi:hypothetical protein